jgi:hypothetical protein
MEHFSVPREVTPAPGEGFFDGVLFQVPERLFPPT